MLLSDDIDLDGDGNDTMTNRGTVEYFNGDKGNDTLINEETGVIETALNGGDGDDTIINKGKIDTIDAGYGDDLVQNYSETHVIWGNKGNDTIINEESGLITNFIAGEDGDDHIINKGTVDGFINGGNGNDTILSSGITTGSVNGGGDTGDNVQNTGGLHDLVYNAAKAEMVRQHNATRKLMGLPPDMCYSWDYISWDAYLNAMTRGTARYTNK